MCVSYWSQVWSLTLSQVRSWNADRGSNWQSIRSWGSKRIATLLLPPLKTHTPVNILNTNQIVLLLEPQEPDYIIREFEVSSQCAITLKTFSYQIVQSSAVKQTKTAYKTRTPTNLITANNLTFFVLSCNTSICSITNNLLFCLIMCANKCILHTNWEAIPGLTSNKRITMESIPLWGSLAKDDLRNRSKLVVKTQPNFNPYHLIDLDLMYTIVVRSFG